MLRKKDPPEIGNQSTFSIKPKPIVEPVTNPAARSNRQPAARSTGSSTYIGEHTQFIGDLTGSSDLSIVGKFKGKISIPKNTVIIEQSGLVEATINAKHIIVKGKIEGQFQAIDTFEVGNTGAVKGDVKARNIVLEHECDFNGSIQMTKEGAAVDEPKPVPQPPKPANPSASGTSPSKGAS